MIPPVEFESRYLFPSLVQRSTYLNMNAFNYFGYIIIILLFWFNRDYSVNDRLDFVLIKIKQDYNANDRLKFVLSFIRWENDLNKWLKHVKNGRNENWK